MAYENLTDLMTGICDAIRQKEGSTDLVPSQEIPERILNLSGGGGTVSYTLPSFFANINDDLVKTYNSTDTITCEVGHTYLVFTTYLIGASYANSQYISVTGADILREASFIMTGEDISSGTTSHNTHISSFILTATQSNVTVQHRFSLGFESMYQTVITLDITDNVTEITDREMLSVSESCTFQSNVGKYYLVLLGSIVGSGPYISSSAEIIYQSNITTGTSAYNHLTSMVLMIVKSTVDYVTAFLNLTFSKNALFYMDISNNVSGGSGSNSDKYTVNFYNDGEIVESHSAKIGHSISAPIDYKPLWTNADNKYVSFPFSCDTNDILNFTYQNLEDQFVPLIPVMTDINAPSGKIESGNNYGNGYYGNIPLYYAFDGDDTTNVHYMSESVSDGFISYEFDNDVYVDTIIAKFGNFLVSNDISATLYVYKNDYEYTVIDTVQVSGYPEPEYGEFSFKVASVCKKIKFVFGYKTNGTNIETYEIQAYGLNNIS